MPIKIDRRDYDRVLLTETLPYETPIIFSSSGIYDQVKKVDSSDIQNTIIGVLIKGDQAPKRPSTTVPLHYKVRKNSLEFRRLSLMHPRAQWKVREFYRDFDSLILHFCSLSPVSIRAPLKIASSYYRKSAWENIAQYREDQVNVLALDEIAKHSPSFFTYRGYDRLYKFFESEDFFNLEKTYPTFWSLDVTKCFDSIYTHCLSWAIKSKVFTKENVSVESTFGQQFDLLMRFANHNETNGILIGPEVSRIFAELLFQRIDADVIAKLASRGMVHGHAFCLRRYVDDVFIFAKSSEVAREIYSAYVDALLDYNLHHNPAKTLKLDRPFASSKSRLIHAASREVNDFVSKFLLESKDTGTLVPLRIKSKWNLTKSFVSSIRTLCSYNQVYYDEVATFLVAVLVERIKKVIQADLSRDDPDAGKSQLLYSDALIVILDVLYFLYDAAPSVSSSYKICAAIALIDRFAKAQLPDKREMLADRIMQLTVKHLTEERISGARRVSGFVPLESLNLLLAVKELGDEFQVPEEMVKSLFEDREKLTYFDITCGLFYAGGLPRYESIVAKLVDAAIIELQDLSDLPTNASKAYLFLDLLTCPFVPDRHKREWIRGLYRSVSRTLPSRAQIDAFLGASVGETWALSWSGIDLLNQLEKKELKQPY